MLGRVKEEELYSGAAHILASNRKHGLRTIDLLESLKKNAKGKEFNTLCMVIGHIDEIVHVGFDNLEYICNTRSARRWMRVAFQRCGRRLSKLLRNAPYNGTSTKMTAPTVLPLVRRRNQQPSHSESARPHLDPASCSVPRETAARFNDALSEKPASWRKSWTRTVRMRRRLVTRKASPTRHRPRRSSTAVWRTWATS